MGAGSEKQLFGNRCEWGKVNTLKPWMVLARSRYHQNISRHIRYDLHFPKLFFPRFDLFALIGQLDITNDLVLQTSYSTASQMKAYKSLEA